MPTPSAFRNDASAAGVKVTVIITTYNHENFIQRALDSVFMQQANFDFEVIVLEDCSTDGTRQILGTYQNHHPGKLRLALAEVNKCDNAALMEAIQTSSSSYIAFLDGDDYWTSPHKLQQQADYLDQHSDCPICFHNVTAMDEAGTREMYLMNPPDQAELCTLDHLIEGCFMCYCSVMLRRTAVPGFPAWFRTDPCSDWTMFVLAALHGNIGYIEAPLAIYRIHAGGFWSGQPEEEQLLRVIQFHQRLGDILPPHYSPVVNQLVADGLYRLAVIYERSGRLEAARDCFSKCWAVEPDARRVKWQLRTAGGNIAKRTFPLDDPEKVRVEIENTASQSAFDTQLNLPYLSVQANQAYSIRFLARADAPRNLFLGFSRAQEPWTSLGLYKSLAVTPEWHSYQEDFIAIADAPNARLHFDLGDSNISFEVSSVAFLKTAEASAIRDGQPS